MAINKFINNPYREPDCIENLIYYATHKDGRWVNFFGGINVDVYHAASQMRVVLPKSQRQQAGKTHFGRVQPAPYAECYGSRLHRQKGVWVLCG